MLCRDALTPLLMFGASKIGIFLLASAIIFFCSSVNPVVPIVIGLPRDSHSFTALTEGSGSEKSITTS